MRSHRHVRTLSMSLTQPLGLDVVRSRAGEQRDIRGVRRRVATADGSQFFYRGRRGQMQFTDVRVRVNDGQ